MADCLTGRQLQPGQHDQNPVTTKHEKRVYANFLFAVSYGSFQRRPFRSSRGLSVIGMFHQLLTNTTFSTMGYVAFCPTVNIRRNSRAAP